MVVAAGIAEPDNVIANIALPISAIAIAIDDVAFLNLPFIKGAVRRFLQYVVLFYIGFGEYAPAMELRFFNCNIWTSKQLFNAYASGTQACALESWRGSIPNTSI